MSAKERISELFRLCMEMNDAELCRPLILLDYSTLTGLVYVYIREDGLLEEPYDAVYRISVRNPDEKTLRGCREHLERLYEKCARERQLREGA